MLTIRDRTQIQVKDAQFNIGIPGWVYRTAWPAGDPFVKGFHSHRSIFVHIPKVAGSSIAEALFGSSVGHRPIRRHLAYHPDIVSKYFKFTFIRNPWDRLYSAYQYFNRRIGSDKHRDHRWATAMLVGINSFEDFVLRLADPALNYGSMIKRYDHFRDQVDWLEDPRTGDLCVDFIGRFEWLERDFEHVMDKLGIDASLPHRRRGAGKSYQEAYSPEMVDIVRSLYSRDIERFAYRFGD